jgi:hypothetical protein
MIDEKKVSEAGRPLPQVPGSGEEERLQAIDKAAMGGLATPNEAPRDAGNEATAQKAVGQASGTVKREAEQALGLTPTTSEKMEQHLDAATTGGTDAGEVSARPRQPQGEAAKDGATSPSEMLEAIVEQKGLGEGPRRGS